MDIGDFGDISDCESLASPATGADFNSQLCSNLAIQCVVNRAAQVLTASDGECSTSSFTEH